MGRIAAVSLILSFSLVSCAPLSDREFDTGPPRVPVLYIADNFDGGVFNPRWSLARVRKEVYHRDNQPVFVKMEGHGEVLHYYKESGTDEVTPAAVYIEGDEDFKKITGRPNIDEFYIEWSEFFPEDHVFAVNGQKLMRFDYRNEGEERGLEVTLAVLNRNRRMQLFLYHPHGTSSGWTLDLGLDIYGLPTDCWVRLGVWARMNTPGESDGFVRVYSDGYPIISRSGLSLRGKDTRGWNMMWVGGNYSNGPGGFEPRASHRYIDDIRLYSTKPYASK